MDEAAATVMSSWDSSRVTELSACARVFRTDRSMVWTLHTGLSQGMPSGSRRAFPYRIDGTLEGDGGVHSTRVSGVPLLPRG